MVCEAGSVVLGPDRGSASGWLVGGLAVAPAVIETRLGLWPVLRFIFTEPGPTPEERHNLPTINLMMEPTGLRILRRVISRAINQAVAGVGRKERNDT